MIGLLSISLLHSQSNNAGNSFSRIALADKDTSLTQDEKLHVFYNIKYELESKHKTNDSAYVFLLIRMARNQSNANASLAVDYLLKALAINKQLPKPASNKIVMNGYYNLARFYIEQMHQSKALACYDSVLSICQQPDPDDYVIDSRYGKVCIYLALGDYEKEAEECSLGIVQAKNKSDTSRLVLFLTLRANAFTLMKRFEDALADLTVAIALNTARSDAKGLANSYQSLAELYKKQEKDSEAERYYLQTIKLRVHNSDFSGQIAGDYNNLGIFYAVNRKDYKKAKENYLKALSYAHRCPSNEKFTYLLSIYVNLGSLCQRENQTEEAINYINLAFTQLTFHNNGFLHNPSLADLLLIESNPNLSILLGNKAELLLSLYKKTAQKKYLDACLQTALLTDSIITQTRHQNVAEGSKLHWRDETREFFNSFIEACYLSQNTEKAFYFMEKSRAVLLNDKWNELDANIHLPQKETEKREYFQFKILNQKEHLASFPYQSPQYNDAQTSLLASIDSLESFIKSLESKYRAYYQSKYADNVPPLSALQNELQKNNQSFVYYFMNDTAMYALAITPNGSRFIKVESDEFDSRQLSQFIRLCSNKQALMSHYDTYCSLAQIIYKKLFQPLQIPNGKVAICTDNFFIPFEALCTDSEGKNYLLQDYSFSYVYSARALLKSFPFSTPSGNFVGFAPVSFSPYLDVADLKQSASALQDAAHFYNTNNLFTQKKATRNQFISQASHYSVVTVFSHAQADTTNTEPVLYMRDSLIHLSDLQMLKDPSIQFVLLSACQTNIGKNATGEGIYSLARGFAAAGIPAVSATLWKADEGAVYEISIKFNEFLSQKMDKDEALQNAKIWYLQNHSNSENCLPFYWANMVLIGSSQPLSLTPSSHYWLWISGVVLFLLLLFSVFFFYKKKVRKTHYDQYIL